MQEPLVEPSNFITPRVSHQTLSSRSVPFDVPSVQTHPNTWFDRQIVLNRFLTHIVVLSLIVSMIALGGISLSKKPLKAPHLVGPQTISSVVKDPDVSQPLSLSTALNNQQDLLLPSVVPVTVRTDLSEPVSVSTGEGPKISRDELQIYHVQSGDTVYGIAAKFGLAPETIHWANKSLEENPDWLSVGQELIILPMDGVYHQVGGSDTIASIAATFNVKPEAIIDYPLNNINPEALTIYPNQWLVVPGGIKPYKPPKYVAVPKVKAPRGVIYGTGYFQWPAKGRISQDYWGGHPGLDIAGWVGASIQASDSGYVVAAQWDNRGYGRMVMIDHGNGYQTLYGHLSSIYVSVGDEVYKGETIGEMGSTGNSTGPHLHFEVLYEGVSHSPWKFLP